MMLKFDTYCDHCQEIDLDMDDVYCSMDSYECQEMADLLYEEGYIARKDDSLEKQLEDLRGITGSEFKNAILKLATNYYQLTPTETDIIITLTKKF